jgi:hypothetical protein
MEYAPTVPGSQTDLPKPGELPQISIANGYFVLTNLSTQFSALRLDVC